MNHPAPSTGRQGRRIVDRETKLALLIGFIAILVVGVLVSDHLSDDGRDELADLTAGDAALAPPIVMPPLESGRRGPAEPPPLERRGATLAQSGGESGPTPLVGHRFDVPVVREESRRENASAERRGESQPAQIVRREPERPQNSERQTGRSDGESVSRGGREAESDRATPAVEDGPPIIHIVTAGETLGEISQRHLGSAGRWKEIQRANAPAVPENGAIRVGMRLVIPRAASASAPSGAGTQTQTQAQSSSQGQAERRAEGGSEGWGRRYTVVEGDTLWRIAQRELGDGGRWREILSANSDVIPGDGGVTVGMQIRLPGRASASAAPAGGAQAQTPPRATSGTRNYTVREGDTLSRIASRELGSVSRMQEILDLNRGVLDDADMVRVGMTIRLPGG